MIRIKWLKIPSAIRKTKFGYVRVTVRNASSIFKLSFAETSIAANKECSFANADASSNFIFLSRFKSDFEPKKTNYNFNFFGKYIGI